MRPYVASLGATILVGGCSLIYNPSNIDKPRADASDPTIDGSTEVDAAIDAPPLADADFSMLTIEKIGPTRLYEGQGIGGSRPAILVVRGHNFADDATVSITPATDLTIGQKVISTNRDFIFVPVTVAINTAAPQTVDLSVSVSQSGAPTQTITDQLKLEYLPELDTGTSIAISSLAPFYSRVNLGNVSFTGTTEVKLRAASSITVGNVSVAGAQASGTTAGAAGPGGCGGGAVASTGGCSGFAGGGLGASGANGGAGGGFGMVGFEGAGGATGGAAHGNAEIVNYVAGATDSNRSGGGGGGSKTGGGSGGAGGGGGGTLELTAGGNITTGTLTADGGKGGNGSGGLVFLTDAGGGGGGGSGGVILIRSVAGTITSGAISAAGGAAGNGAQGGGGGGAGAEGRIRIDAPVAAPATNPTAYRGPAYLASTPTYVTTVNPVLTLSGTDTANLDGWLIDMDGAARYGEPVDQIVANGTVTVTPTLIPGYNKLCFTLAPATRPLTPMPNPLADACIEIAYLP